jgi:hypothetical protein
MSDNQETVVSRFLRSSNLYSSDKNEVKYRAFLPRDNKISVYNTTGLNDSEIWQIGASALANATIRGRGDLQVSDVQAIELEIEWDNSPPLHANIVLPLDDAGRISMAQQLAAKATLVLKN